MAARTASRAVQTAYSKLDLPTLSHPQLAGEEEIALDDSAFEVQQQSAARAEELSDEQARSAKSYDEDGMAVDGEGEQLEEADEAGPEVEDENQELLGVGDSLVLPYSLLQSRQRHLHHLLPRIFSHPVIPGHNRPRVRHYHKGAFVFPTPQAPSLPLPLKEYHGPVQNTAATTGARSTPKEGSTELSKEAGPSQSASKAARRAARIAEKENEAPPHEIDCIARVTLSIGPISYPGTELWVGRFVKARPVVLREKAPLEKKVDRPDLKGKRPSSPGDGSRPPGSSTSRAIPSPLSRGLMVPSSSAANQPPSKATPRSGPQFGPAPPPSMKAPPSRSNIHPTIIARVNAAAARHPWLSGIIHKAAKSTASQEELAKLSRVVARLTRGEDVGEGAEDGLTPPVDPPTSSAADSGSSGLSTSLIVATGNSSAAAPTGKDDGDSNSDVDMTGPEQVGGGPLPPVALFPPTTEKASAPLMRRQDASRVESPSIKGPSVNTPRLAAGATLPPRELPPSDTEFSAHKSTAETSSFRASLAAQSPAAATTVPPLPYPRASVTTPSPITAVPPAALPPPFLLVAFKEAPTEKFLLPLGSQSFVSRVGDDGVTRPRPLSPISKVTESLSSVPADKSETPIQPESVQPLQESIAARHRRLRTSSGRQTKQDTPMPLDITQGLLSDPPDAPTASPLLASSGLPALPGMSPQKGTVLLSMVAPVGPWNKVDWENMGKGLPFDNSAFGGSLANEEIKQEPEQARPDTAAGKSVHPKSAIAPQASRKALKRIPKVLNLAAIDFTPDMMPVQPITIHLAGIDDKVWSQMRAIMLAVESAELTDMLAPESDILLEAVPTSSQNLHAHGLGSDTISKPNSGTQLPTSLIADPAALRLAYFSRKQARFASLLARAPSRRFLQYRLPTPPPEIRDAMSDRWAPRPYRLSTKALYERTPPPENEETLPTADLPRKKSRREPLPEVEFEMPVSLDQLDERVEEGAKYVVGRKKLKNVRKGRKESDIPAVGADEAEGAKKKRIGKRGLPGKACEGCAREGLSVWRRGPAGKGTLCMDCGDKYVAGTLGPLKAPGVVSDHEPGVPNPGAADNSDKQVVLLEETGTPPDAENRNGIPSRDDLGEQEVRLESEAGAIDPADTEDTALPPTEDSVAQSTLVESGGADELLD